MTTAPFTTPSTATSSACALDLKTTGPERGAAARGVGRRDRREHAAGRHGPHRPWLRAAFNGESGLIYCSISAYGQDGPYAERPGVDGIIQADSGLMSIIGTPESEPCKVQAPVIDVFTGYVAGLGILAKLAERRRDGRGGHLDASLMNSARRCSSRPSPAT